MMFENRTASELAQLGETRTPSITDLFVARMQPPGAWVSPAAEVAA